MPDSYQVTHPVLGKKPDDVEQLSSVFSARNILHDPTYLAEYVG